MDVDQLADICDPIQGVSRVGGDMGARTIYFSIYIPLNNEMCSAF